MAKNSNIEWTDATVNFWWGCTKVGLGCDNCYAEKWSGRFGGHHWGHGAPRRKIKSANALIHRLDNDYSEWAADYHAATGNAHLWGRPIPTIGLRQRVFIQSMSDIFDTEIPLEWFRESWGKIKQCNRIEIQIVTKRISVVEKRLAAIGSTTWPQHAVLIITIVNQEEADRDIPRLLKLKQKLNIPLVGLSMEPMLGPVDLSTWIGRLDWIITGGESGPNARPMHPDWVRDLRDQCEAADTPFFFKQWGQWGPKSANPQSKKFTRKVWLDGKWHDLDPDNDDYGSTEFMHCMGKVRAGRLLDGVEHSEFPKCVEAV